jgi:hypothetical protein
LRDPESDRNLDPLVRYTDPRICTKMSRIRNTAPKVRYYFKTGTEIFLKGSGLDLDSVRSWPKMNYMVFGTAGYPVHHGWWFAGQRAQVSKIDCQPCCVSPKTNRNE